VAPILKCEKDDPRKELEFELDYQLSLTTAQRFHMMLRRSREMARMLRDHGHRQAPVIIKRPIRSLRAGTKGMALRKLKK